MSKIVKFKKSLKGQLRDESLVQDAVKSVKEQLVDEKILESHKYDTQMLIDICNYVEKNACDKTKKQFQTNKKNVVLKIFSELYSDVDLDLIDSSIETIINNDLVKKYTLLYRILRKLSNFFLKINNIWKRFNKIIFY